MPIAIIARCFLRLYSGAAFCVLSSERERKSAAREVMPPDNLLTSFTREFPRFFVKEGKKA